MYKTEKEFYIHNRGDLMHNLKYNAALVAHLEGKKLICSSDIDEIDSAFRNKGNQEAVFRLLNILITRPGSHAVLLEIAKELNQHGAVEILQKYDHELPKSVTTDVLDGKAVSANLASGGLDKSDFVSYSDLESLEMQEIISGKKKLVVELERPKPNEPERVFDKNNSHVLQPGQLRLAFLLNIVGFENDGAWGRRTGSEKDVKNLSKLLVQLGYVIYPEKAFREKEMKNFDEVKSSIKEFREICNQLKPQSIFVFSGTHGFHPFQLAASDTSGVPRDGGLPHPSLDLFENLVLEFSHQRCPGLIGKPKVFLIQACQSFLPRYEQDSARYIDDAVIYTSVLPGEASFRNREGSVFICCFTYVMMRHAKDMSFQEIMERVNEMSKLYKTATGVEQISMPISFMAKKLYFSFET